MKLCKSYVTERYNKIYGLSRITLAVESMVADRASVLAVAVGVNYNLT